MTTMLTQGARAIMEGYIATLGARGPYADYFTPDVVVQMPAEGAEVKGRDAVAAFIRDFHEKAFDAHPRLTCLVADGEHAAAEFVFEGTHTGEFVGIAATGKHVQVPYTAFYDLEAGRIKALRLYGFGVLVEALKAH